MGKGDPVTTSSHPSPGDVYVWAGNDKRELVLVVRSRCAQADVLWMGDSGMWSRITTATFLYDEEHTEGEAQKWVRVRGREEEGE